MFHSQEVSAVKKTVVLSCCLCLLIGLLAGGALYMFWEEETAAPGTILQGPSNSAAEGGVSPQSPGLETPKLDQTDNFSLLGTAGYAVQAMKDRDFKALSALVDPDRGVTFTPYSTVDPSRDQTLNRQEVAAMGEDTSPRTWGLTDGTGEPIRMTAGQYMESYVFDVDYTRAPMIGIDRVLLSGNALENVSEVYPDCRFVDFTFPENDGADWSSLKLVFAPGEENWYLVGVIHGQWTI